MKSAIGLINSLILVDTDEIPRLKRPSQDDCFRVLLSSEQHYLYPLKPFSVPGSRQSRSLPQGLLAPGAASTLTRF